MFNIRQLLHKNTLTDGCWLVFLLHRHKYEYAKIQAQPKWEGVKKTATAHNCIRSRTNDVHCAVWSIRCIVIATIDHHNNKN